MNFQILPNRDAQFAMLVLTAFVSGMAAVHDARAQDTDAARQKAFEKAKIAYEVAWQRAPLELKTLIFVVEPAQFYGHYEARESSVFTNGERMVVYIEPTGFGHGRKGGLYTIDLDVGMELRTPEGKVLLTTNSSERVGLESTTRNMEFQSSLSYAFRDLPAGQYILYLTVDDANSHKKGNFELPFSIQ